MTIDSVTTTPTYTGAAPRFVRVSDGRLLGGVSTGLARHLGLQPLTVRVGFALLAAVVGFGIVLYVALWMFTPLDSDMADQDAPAGVAAATRAGKRQRLRFLPRPGDIGQLIALGAFTVGAVWLVQLTPLGVSPQVLVPLLLAVGGVALIWRSADEQERRRMAELSPKAPWLAAITGGGRRAVLIRLAAGSVAIVLGVFAFLAGQGELYALRDGLIGLVALLMGVVLIAGPWLWRIWRDLNAERRERIVSQERADMAAHLHDSVLQTLALIQKRAHDPRAVVTLARRQERDLRRWLFESSGGDEKSFGAALKRMAVEVEEAHGVPVEVVTVGEGEINDGRRAVLNAAREAAVNAAKHSGADLVDVFAEISDDGVEVFVRDRGVGFDPDDVPDDRLGVRRSIVERMERHGGHATIRSAHGEGTEVRLSTYDGAGASAPQEGTTHD